MADETTKTLNPLLVELAALKLLVRALICHMLVDDPDEANDAIDALVARVATMSDAAFVGETKADELAKIAVRTQAISLIADLRKTKAARQ